MAQRNVKSNKPPRIAPDRRHEPVKTSHPYIRNKSAPEVKSKDKTTAVSDIRQTSI